MAGLSRRLARTQQVPGDVPSNRAAFGEFAPDQPFLSGDKALAFAEGIFPREDGTYSPFKSPQQISETTLDSRVSGAFSARDTSGVAWTFAGTNTKLYESNDYNYVDVSKAGDYTVGTEENWEFAQFKGDVIATQLGNPVQSKTIGSAGTAFADLITGTNKPTARRIMTLRNFLVLGNTNDTTDGARPQRVWWSAFNNPANFDPDATTQSDFEDLPDGGLVQQLVGGQEYGVIFQTNMIRRMSYVGPPAIFSFDPVDRTRGTPIPRSVAGRGRRLGYIAEEGFMMFDGLESIPVGDGKVDRSFWNDFDINQAAAVSSDLDPREKLILWAYPSNGGDQGRPNRIAIYNWDSRRWSFVDVKTELIFNAFTLGINVDTADSRLNNIDTSVWASESLDSALFKGGQTAFSLFDYSHVQNLLTGPNLAMRIETKDIQMVPGFRAYIDKLRPLIEGPTEVTLLWRDDLGGSLIQGNTKPKNGNELAFQGDVQSNARYHRIRITNPEGTDWNRALGWEAYARQTGAYNGGSG